MEPSGDSIAIRLVVIIILLGLSSFFFIIGDSLTTVKQDPHQDLAEAGNQSAVWVMKLGEDQGRMLSAILIGNNVVNLSASSMLTVLQPKKCSAAGPAGAATGSLPF